MNWALPAHTIPPMRALLAAGLVAAVLAGCGGSSVQQPQMLPPVASVTPSPSASQATIPPEAAGPDARSAEAFARFFYSQVEKAFATKDPALIQSLSLPECSTCAAYIGSLTTLRDNNESIQGGKFAVTYALSPGAQKGMTPVDVSVNFSGSLRKDSRGRVLEEERPLRRVEEELQLKRMNGRWLISEIKRIRVRG